MAKHRNEELVMGEDSFLDTIANLTGILIILVVIVGARSQAVAKTAARQAYQAEVEKLASPYETTKNLERDVAHQVEQLQQYDQELAYRDTERMTILDRLNIAEKVLDDQAKELDETGQQDLAVQLELTELQKELSRLVGQQGELPSGEPTVVALQHLPTPMAKTVFGKELHVMCRQGAITVIPWDRLVEALRQEARRSAERNSQREKFVNRLGPIEGFVMQYGLISKSGMVSNGTMATTAKLIELDRFELEPTDDIIRESVAQALSPGGRLRAELSAYQAGQTTITAWVYPDSFREFRTMKEGLYRLGFLCAARPLPDHIRIGASPRGSSSSAQ